MKTEPVQVRLYISTGYANAFHESIEEVDREEWESMTQKEKDAWLEQAAMDFMGNHISCSASVINE